MYKYVKRDDRVKSLLEVVVFIEVYSGGVSAKYMEEDGLAVEVFWCSQV